MIGFCTSLIHDTTYHRVVINILDILLQRRLTIYFLTSSQHQYVLPPIRHPLHDYPPRLRRTSCSDVHYPPRAVPLPTLEDRSLRIGVDDCIAVCAVYDVATMDGRGAGPCGTLATLQGAWCEDDKVVERAEEVMRFDGGEGNNMKVGG